MTKPKRIQRPRLEINSRSQIGADVDIYSLNVFVDDKRGETIELSRKDAERLLVFLGKAIAYIDSKGRRK